MTRRRLLVPEAVQTSAMDCGPACLHAVLEAFGLPSSYDRLRDECHTHLDGTSIDAIEQMACELGLEAEQIMIPVDHALLPEARTEPSIAIVRLASGLTHFIVLWKRFAGTIEIMDPAEGRQFVPATELTRRLHIHEQAVSAEGWREFAGSPDFLGPLRRRASQAKLPRNAIEPVIERALSDTSWRSLAVMDAAVRMLSGVNRAGAGCSKRAMGMLFEGLLARVRSDPAKLLETIPTVYWSVLPLDREGSELLFRGAVLVRIAGAREPVRHLVNSPVPGPSEQGASEQVTPETSHAIPMRAPASRPRRQANAGAGLRRLFEYLRADGRLAPGVVATALFIGSVTVVAEAAFYRTFLELAGTLTLSAQRLAALGLFLGLLGASIALEWWSADGLLRAGRKLEIRLRAHILERIPRMPDSYFGSRLVSDLAERAHAIHEIRGTPMLGGRFIRSSAELIVTLAGIAWLDPNAAGLALACAASSIALPFLFRPVLTERDLRFRTHSGGLCRFYFDALRGLTAIHAHSADRAVRIEHEGLLVSWANAGLSLQRMAVALDSAGLMLNSFLVAWLVIRHVTSSGPAEALLLVYWALNIPALGSRIAQLGWQYPRLNNLASRVLEPLVAEPLARSDDETGANDRATAAPVASNSSGVPVLTGRRPGVAIEFRGVTVRAMGQTILEVSQLSIAPGSHVCIVGQSGAGKSTLAGTLLGWYLPITGQIGVDGLPLTAASMESLRLETAWVDPSVQIWNQSLFENLRYGAPSGGDPHLLGEAIERTGLLSLVERLPDGLQSPLGESGARVSGGEAQRIRLARAAMRPSARLVILDEAFTAIDREKRRELLLEGKKIWRNATLLSITHDLSDTLLFDRVLVVDRGRIVEDGTPAALLATESHLRRMVEAGDAVSREVWPEQEWRRLRLEHGQLAESGMQPGARALPGTGPGSEPAFLASPISGDGAR